jgi:hypothetical protein
MIYPTAELCQLRAGQDYFIRQRHSGEAANPQRHPYRNSPLHSPGNRTQGPIGREALWRPELNEQSSAITFDRGVNPAEAPAQRSLYASLNGANVADALRTTSVLLAVVRITLANARCRPVCRSLQLPRLAEDPNHTVTDVVRLRCTISATKVPCVKQSVNFKRAGGCYFLSNDTSRNAPEKHRREHTESLQENARSK